MILAIDPGTTESAYCLIDDDYKPIEFGKIQNINMYDNLNELYSKGYLSRECKFVIESISSYGNNIGKTTIDTAIWIGRFYEMGLNSVQQVYLIYRREVKRMLGLPANAKDKDVTEYLIERFGDTNTHGKYSKGTKNNQGFFYGFAKDVWQAYALGVAYLDNVGVMVEIEEM